MTVLHAIDRFTLMDHTYLYLMLAYELITFHWSYETPVFLVYGAH